LDATKEQGQTGRDTQLRSDCGQNLEPIRQVLQPEAAEGFEDVVGKLARCPPPIRERMFCLTEWLC
jgi:hypothetical protein